MVGALLSIVLLAIFLGGFFVAFRAANGMELLKTVNGLQWAALLIVFLTVIAFVGFLESEDDFIYYWDNLLYWLQSVNQAQTLFHHPLQGLRDLYASINNNDYNFLLPTLIAVPLKVFGYTHSAYLCLNAAIWFVPTLIVQMCICIKIMECFGIRHQRILAVVSVVLAATFSAFYYALLNSYSDVAVLLPISISILMLFQWEPTRWDRSQLKYAILMSCVLMAIVLFRRHFAFYVLAFGCAMVFKAICGFATEKNKERSTWLNPIIFIVIVAAFALIVLGVLFTKFLVHALLTNYAGAYVGYDAPLPSKLSTLMSYFGMSIFAFIAVSVVGMIKQPRIRVFWWMMALMAIIVPILFFRVQAIGVQHVLNLAIPVFLICFCAFAFLWGVIEKSGSSVAKGVAGALAVLLFTLQGLNFAYAFASHRIPAMSFLKQIAPLQYTPAIRSDTAELHALADYVNEQEADDGEKTVYVLSSGSTLNESLMRYIDFPASQDGIPGLQYTSDADLRDGFPRGFLDADFVITTDPLDLHLAAGTQETVRYLAEGLLDPDSAIGKHYEKIASFPLQHGKEALVYKKISNYSEDDLNVIRDYFENYYPGQDELFGDWIKLDQ